jgi:hypothetical protein
LVPQEAEDSEAAAPAEQLVAAQQPAELTFEEELAALESERASQAARLAAELEAIAQQDHTTKQQRRQAAADSQQLAARIAHMQAAEQKAVLAEDYDSAARLSADQDSAKLAQEALEAELHAADSMQRAAADRHLALVQDQAAMWQGVAAALRALLHAQQERKAAAEARAAHLAAAAEEAEADALNRMQELKQQEEQLRHSVQTRQAELDKQQQEEEGLLQAQREEHTATHAALEAEVEALRCVGTPAVLTTNLLFCAAAVCLERSRRVGACRFTEAPVLIRHVLLMCTAGQPW